MTSTIHIVNRHILHVGIVKTRLATKYIKSNICPLCGKDLRPTTVLLRQERARSWPVSGRISLTQKLQKGEQKNGIIKVARESSITLERKNFSGGKVMFKIVDLQTGQVRQYETQRATAVAWKV